MDPKNNNLASGNGGKPGEQTPAATGAASERTNVEKNLTPAGVASLLESEFAQQPDGDRGAAATLQQPKAKPGEEVQPAGKGGDDQAAAKVVGKEPDWSADQRAWFELRGKAKTPEEIAAADTQAPEFSEEQRAWIEAANAGGEPPEGGTPNALPEHLEAELAQWEERGGELPPSLQKLVEKRIGKLVGEKEQHKKRADTAEAEAARLRGELETAGASAPANLGGLDEKGLSNLTLASKSFLSDARAFVDGYADDAQTTRMQKHMETHGQDEKALKRQIAEVSDWLTQEAPAVRQRIAEFKTQEASVEPMVKEHFPWLEDKASPEYAIAAKVLKDMPELKSRMPAYKVVQGIWVLGMQAFQAKLAGKNGGANGAGKTPFFLPGKAPAKTPLGGKPVIAPRVTGNQAQQEAASQKLQEAPTAENMEAAMRLSLKV